MYSINDINDILDEVADELPDEIFRELNGGVCLYPETKHSAADPYGRLYTLGEYRRDQMGRYVVIYYGSVCAVHGDEPPDMLRDSLKKILTHELTHHLESLSGERDLEIEDAIDLANYLNH
ncbi:MAG: metallopeptidase family protein [Oscillospiraceae bacterium]|nr:metallopeptidase family protein [Oscillospiraceae bacterium]